MSDIGMSKSKNIEFNFLHVGHVGVIAYEGDEERYFNPLTQEIEVPQVTDKLAGVLSEKGESYNKKEISGT